MAPPVKPLDPKQIKLLADIGCTHEEIAAALGTSPDTLTRRYADLLKGGKHRFAVSVRRAQFRLLLNGNATMGIWLGKQVLGQRDRLTVGGEEDGEPIRLQPLKGASTKDLEALAKKLALLMPKETA